MITGGCLCGAVRYQATGEPAMSVICYCRDCQRASGSGNIPAMCFPRDAVTVHGETKSFASLGGSGKLTVRHFCPTCGSLLFGTPEITPHLFNIYAGTLDDPAMFKPTWSFCSSSHAAWDPVTLPEFVRD